MALAGQSGAIIYTIGVLDENDPDRGPRALKQRATKVRVEKGRTADIELKVVPWPE